VSTNYTPERYIDEGKRSRLHVIFSSDVDASIDAYYPNIDTVTPQPAAEVSPAPAAEITAPDKVVSIASNLMHAELSEADQIRQTVAQIHKQAA
jgi:hypothetical protein